MALILLGIFLIIYGMQVLLSLAIPAWVSGLLALIAGIVLLVQGSGVEMPSFHRQ